MGKENDIKTLYNLIMSKKINEALKEEALIKNTYSNEELASYQDIFDLLKYEYDKQQIIMIVNDLIASKSKIKNEII